MQRLIGFALAVLVNALFVGAFVWAATADQTSGTRITAVMTKAGRIGSPDSNSEPML
jgi:hypothetical protein